MRYAVCMIVWVMASPALALQTTKPSTQTATTGPASTMPAGAVALKANVTSVKGNVQVRTSESAPWQPAKVGMQLDQGVEIRTGLRSAIQFVISGDQTITLDRLGTVTVLQAFQTKGKATTDIGLKYGRTRYDIKATDLEHESTIRSPGSTLAIRGTDITYEDQAPWVPTAVSREGRAQFRNFKRQSVAFGGTKRANVAADKNSPGQVAVTNTKSDPKGQFAGRTQSEDELNVTLSSTGGLDTQDFQAFRALATGFSGDTFTGIPNVPGPLQFSLNWATIAGSAGASNLDLLITDPRSNTASAINPVIGSGSATGMHFGDDQGAQGLGGEVVLWERFFPTGTYHVEVIHRGGADAEVQNLLVEQGSSSVKQLAEPTFVLKAGESFAADVTTDPTSSVSAKAARREQRQAVRAAQRSLRKSGK